MKKLLLALALCITTSAALADGRGTSIAVPDYEPGRPHYSRPASIHTLDCGNTPGETNCDGTTEGCGCFQWVVIWRRQQATGFGFGLSAFEGIEWGRTTGKTKEEVEKKRDSTIAFEKRYAKFFDIPFDKNYADPTAALCDRCDPNAKTAKITKQDIEDIKELIEFYKIQSQFELHASQMGQQERSNVAPQIATPMAQVKKNGDQIHQALNGGFNVPAGTKKSVAPAKAPNYPAATAAAKKGQANFDKLPPRIRNEILLARPGAGSASAGDDDSDAPAAPQPTPRPTPNPRYDGVAQLGSWAGPTELELSVTGEKKTRWVTVSGSTLVVVHEETKDCKDETTTFAAHRIADDDFFVFQGIGNKWALEIGMQPGYRPKYKDCRGEESHDKAILYFNSKSEAESAKISIEALAARAKGRY